MDKKWIRKKGGAVPRLLALMMCCVFLCGSVLPVGSYATSAEIPVSVEMELSQTQDVIGVVETSQMPEPDNGISLVAEPEIAAVPLATATEAAAVTVPATDALTDEAVEEPDATAAEGTATPIPAMVDPVEETPAAPDSGMQDGETETPVERELATNEPESVSTETEPEGAQTEKTTEGTETETDTEGTTSAEESEADAVPVSFDCEKSVSGAGYVVTVKYTENAGIPEGAVLSVEELSGNDYENCLTSVQAALGEGQVLSTARFFNIRFLYNGEEVQPAAGGTVGVNIEFTNGTSLTDGSRYDVVRVNNGAVNVIGGSDVTASGISFVADSASVFGVVGVSEAESEEEAAAITITFRVDKEEYTNDPGSGNTHLTSSAPIEGGELTYTSWAGRYKVTGTGMVCSYDIPAGTSLSGNGLSTPSLSVENIGSGNTYTYISSRSWVTAAGTVSGVDTVFYEDTELYLSLYESTDGYYSLDFVCCEEHNSSISYYMSKSATFKLGESVSADYIPDYELVTTKFTSAYHDVATFYGWQVKVTETGEMVDFGAGTPLTAEYVDSDNYGNAIKVYAVWTVPEVTAVFVHDGDTVESRTLSAGDALGELPEMDDYVADEESFLGWQYTDANGNSVYATAQTIISEDTTYTAVFGEAAHYDVNFHDVQPDGSEGDITISLSVQEGKSLEQAILRENPALANGSLISDCIWYTIGEDGSKTKLDFSDGIVTGEMDLYTYTYQIVLTLNPQAAEAAIMAFSLVEVETAADGTLTMTITAREGETLDASDFVVDGVDYSLYAWTYSDEEGESQTLDVQSLITDGVTENITATSDGTLASSRMTAVEGHTVNFYIFLDGERVLLETRTVTSYTNGSNRHYLSAATLESVYGAYGFTASQLISGTHYFPHTDANSNTIWADASVLEVDGRYYSPITNNTGDVDVYYLPNQTLTSNSAAWTNYQTTDTFYSVQVKDPGGKVYTAATLPKTTYTITGQAVSVTVDNAEGVTWQCVGRAGGTVSSTDNGDGTTTFTITNIDQLYVISPNGVVEISYNINLTVTPSDSKYGTPTIEGGSTYYTITSEGTHTVLAPSLTSFFYTNGKYLGEATFDGWAVNGDTTSLIQPGAVLNLKDYGGSVTLTAQWTTKLGGTTDKTGSMVNFFVSLGALPEGVTDWTGSTSSTAFTQSVYTVDCGVAASTAVEQNLYSSVTGGQYFVLGGTGGTNLNDNHTTITSELSAGYNKTGSDGNAYTFKASFPTDEAVLQTVRQMVASGTVITINGSAITAEELTAESFTVKWYVFKYDTTDGWHIDGILVAKTGQMVVTKTFAGDTTAINGIEEEYSITVSGGSVNTGGTLTLNESSYSTYDSTTNTYTWLVPVDQYWDYTVSENNYISDASLTTTTAQYSVRNAHNSAQNTGGWLGYSSGVSVTGQGHHEGDTGRLTVSFLNTYTAPGTLILQKVDAATGNLMSGVSFTIAKSDGSSFTVYDLGNGRYSADSTDGGTATTTITTDYSGQAYLWIGGGSYTFTEQVPTGYDDPGSISVVLEGDEENQYKVIAITSASAANGAQFVTKGTDTLELIVKNYSRTIDLTIEKIWADGENKPVTIQLYRNGVAMGSDYTVTLDGKTDTVENTAWKCVFTDLPLYADGGLAQYSIREEGLGDFKYSDEYPDGYRYYDVTYSDMRYLDESGAVAGDMTEVSTIALSVTNRRSTGALSISKVDQNGAALPGAEFWLYAVPADSEESTPSYSVSKDTDGHNILSDATYIKSAISDANGLVNFGNMAAGRYYLVEHAAPENYDGSDDLYMLVMTESGTTMYRWTGTGWEQMANPSVSNTAQTVDVTITKQVTGNLGDRNRSFSFTVTCDEPMAEGTGYTLSNDGKTATFSLKHGESLTLEGVRKGATLTIVENNADGYTMTVEVGALNDQLTGNSYTIPDSGSGVISITVTNHKEGIVDTGVIVETLPYVLILAIVAAGAVLFLKKRKNRDDD